jgi:hypothetical protein
MLEWRKHLMLLLALLSHLGISDSRSDQHSNAPDGIRAAGHQKEPVSRSNNQPTCGVWIARSTIPNAGLGMYAGRHFDEGENLTASGDVVIPIVDMEMHQGSDWLFLWDAYTWDIDDRHNDGIQDVSFASPGFGSAANCVQDLLNVEELSPEHSLAGLHRSKDPGAGALSPYHNRRSIAKVPIRVGQELFVDCKLKSVL